MNKNMSSTRKLAIMGVMMALTLIGIFIGLIPLNTVSATIAHIPTIIVGIILGPIYGLVMGAAFGIMTMLRAIIAPPSPWDALFMNPLVSVLPRMMIGLVAGYVFKLVSLLFKKRQGIVRLVGSALAGILGSFTNTFLVLGALYLLYAKKIVDMYEMADTAAVKAAFIGIVGTSGVGEAILSMLVCVAVISAYYAVYKNEINASLAEK